MSQILQVQSGRTNVQCPDGLVRGSLEKFLVDDRTHDRLATGSFVSDLTDLGPGVLLSGIISLSSVSANNTDYATITPGFSGQVRSSFAIVTTVASTAGKSATLGLFIDQDAGGSATKVQCLGGSITLTTATVTPAAGKIPGTNIVAMDRAGTQPNQFSKDATIVFRTTSAPTAFVEGAVIFGVVVEPIARV